MHSQDDMSPLIRKLRMRAALDERDVAAVLALPLVLRSYETPAYIVREGMPTPYHCSFIRSGFAIRHKLTNDGHRQIVGMCLPGDFIDLQHLFLDRADHNVQVLSRVEAIDIDRAALQALALGHPNIARALWTDTLIEASIHREWVLNVGRRDARQSVAHLLCEFALRMNAAGPDEGAAYELPMTQEQLGDAVGLTSVHINRTLKSLIADGIIQRDKRYLSFRDWKKIQAVGDFSAFYLHLDQAEMRR